jgi:hypothetical protein
MCNDNNIIFYKKVLVSVSILIIHIFYHGHACMVLLSQRRVYRLRVDMQGHLRLSHEDLNIFS